MKSETQNSRCTKKSKWSYVLLALTFQGNGGFWEIKMDVNLPMTG